MLNNMETNKSNIDAGTAFALTEAEMRRIAAVENQHYFNPAQRADIQAEQNFDNFVMQKTEVSNNTRDLQIAQVRNKAPYIPIFLPADHAKILTLNQSNNGSPIFVQFPQDAKIVRIKCWTQANVYEHIALSFKSQNPVVIIPGVESDGMFILCANVPELFLLNGEPGIWVQRVGASILFSSVSFEFYNNLW